MQNKLIYKYKNLIKITTNDYNNATEKEKIDFHFFRIKQVKRRRINVNFKDSSFDNYIIMELNYIRKLKNKSILNFK